MPEAISIAVRLAILTAYEGDVVWLGFERGLLEDTGVTIVENGTIRIGAVCELGVSQNVLQLDKG